MQVQIDQRRVSFKEALLFWIKLGFISFGGPAGQIALMHRELVDKRRWLGEERFLHALNYCMLLPGPEAQQLAVYIGWLMHRTLGGIVAGAFFVIPSIFILIGLSYIYAAYGDLPVVGGILEGFKPVVVAIVAEALLKIGKRALKGWIHHGIGFIAFISIYLFHVPFPFIVLIAALIGLAAARFQPPASQELFTNDDAEDNLLPLAVDDNALPPEHTRPSRPRFLKTLFVGLLLWSIPLVGLIFWQGGRGLHSQEYLFFTQSALVTFGGAYAVLAYVTQAVTTVPYNWLTPAQAVDGLALAETTPGPLIMVLQFVGFMAGWNNPLPGLGQTESAIIGALVTTYTTFLPSFLFIFLGAPYLEYLRGNKVLSGALSGITAAIVGVILNLAIVFGFAVIAPNGISGEINWFAALLSIAAFAALSGLKIDVLWVILAGGAIGLISVFA